MTKSKYVCMIDNTYGFDGIRVYKPFCPTLRADRFL